jgi:bifunctional non-homologous end joining protein LigD
VSRRDTGIKKSRDRVAATGADEERCAFRVGGHTVEVSHPDKVLFPDDGITKRDLAEYYRRIGPKILPFLKDRPLSLQRFPDGINWGFYEKKAPEYFPEWFERVRVKVKEGGSQQQLMCNNVASLVYLADQACITPHPWLSKKGRLDSPDRMIFDLDPAEQDFAAVKAAALTLKEVLEQAKLVPFVMTTGSRGLHVVAPLEGKEDFDRVRGRARELAEEAASREPNRLTVEPRKDARRGRTFIDYLRNAYGQTSVPPYAVRARKGAPVAVPLRWSELASPGLTATSYNVRNVPERLGRVRSPWSGFLRSAGSLSDRPDSFPTSPAAFTSAGSRPVTTGRQKARC